MTIPLLLLVAAFALILANGFFVAAEFGLVTVERPEAERAAAEGDRRARTVVKALRELSFQLSGTQLGITITSLVVGMLAEPALAALLAGPLEATGLPKGAVPGVAVVIGMLLASAVQMVVGELVPKNWAVSRPLQVARFVASTRSTPSPGPSGRSSRPSTPSPTGWSAPSASSRPTRWPPPAPPANWSPWSAIRPRPAALEQDTADLFVRTLSLGELTAQLVMTPGSGSRPSSTRPPRPTCST